jgi:methylenetetrahydrofolate dehydrogenase (NADP+)/methenyltetrahydrofolate cyclohydrolase
VHTLHKGRQGWRLLPVRLILKPRSILALKKRKADAAGVVLTIHELPASADTAEVVETIHEALATASGIVVQLPLPAHIDREAVLAAVPVTHDPDGFWYGHDERACASPVVVAISEIARTYDVSFAGRRVVVVGEGRLVGTPAAHFLRSVGAQVVVVGQDTPDRTTLLQGADIIVTGAGKPGIITPELVREGVIVFDAGTSEDGGMLVGDVALR